MQQLQIDSPFQTFDQVGKVKAEQCAVQLLIVVVGGKGSVFYTLVFGNGLMEGGFQLFQRLGRFREQFSVLIVERTAV